MLGKPSTGATSPACILIRLEFTSRAGEGHPREMPKNQFLSCHQVRCPVRWGLAAGSIFDSNEPQISGPGTLMRFLASAVGHSPMLEPVLRLPVGLPAWLLSSLSWELLPWGLLWIRHRDPQEPDLGPPGSCSSLCHWV